MKLNIEPIKNWFGYTRRERRASFILILIIISILAIRIFIPEKNIQVKDITASLSFTEDLTGINGIDEAYNAETIPDHKVRSDTTDRKRIFTPHRNRLLINLNNCDTSQLISLPGIGPVLSLRIIKYRNLLGGFASVDQLREVYGLTPETYELIKGRVFADSSEVVRIKINSAGYKELSRLPYFEKYEIKAILKYRELKGRIEGLNDLTNNNLIPAEKARKVRSYLKFE